MEYYSAIKRNASESVLMRRMNLEPIIQSECIYVIYECIYMESTKVVLINLFAEQQWRCRHREQTCGRNGGRRGRDELKE